MRAPRPYIQAPAVYADSPESAVAYWYIPTAGATHQYAFPPEWLGGLVSFKPVESSALILVTTNPVLTLASYADTVPTDLAPVTRGSAVGFLLDAERQLWIPRPADLGSTGNIYLAVTGTGEGDGFIVAAPV